MKHSSRAVLLSLILLSGSAFADWTAIASKDFEMEKPPAPGSAAYKKDFEELHRLQDTRDDKDCAFSAAQEHPTYHAFYSDAGILSEAELEAAEAVVSKVIKVTIRISGFFKGKYMRPRPFNVDKTLKPCVKKPGGSKAYPSSHAAAATASACVLAKIYPKKAQRIESHGEYSGRLRAIVGVHHPTDVQAGQQLGEDICERLFTEPDFKKELP